MKIFKVYLEKHFKNLDFRFRLSFRLDKWLTVFQEKKLVWCLCNDWFSFDILVVYIESDLLLGEFGCIRHGSWNKIYQKHYVLSI